MMEVSRVIGVRATAVRMPFADAAIDVDKPEDLEAVERILAGRPV
jgi:CTP:molybdopterin cytidylyltransferase MocA